MGAALRMAIAPPREICGRFFQFVFDQTSPWEFQAMAKTCPPLFVVARVGLCIGWVGSAQSAGDPARRLLDPDHGHGRLAQHARARCATKPN